MKEGLSDGGGGGGHPTQLLPSSLPSFASLPRLQRPSRDGRTKLLFLPPMAAKPTKKTDELNDGDGAEDSVGGRRKLSECSAVLSSSAQTA